MDCGTSSLKIDTLQTHSACCPKCDGRGLVENFVINPEICEICQGTGNVSLVKEDNFFVVVQGE